MRRNYSIVDLVRFAKLSQERVGEKPIDLLKEYDKKFPELTAKQKYENLLRALGVEKATELERALAERLNESSNCNKPHVIGSLPTMDDMYEELERRFKFAKHEDDYLPIDDTQVGFEECFKWMKKFSEQ